MRLSEGEKYNQILTKQKLNILEYSKLEEISIKGGDQKNKSMTDHLMNMIDSESISREIKEYFDDIQKACAECQVRFIWFLIELL